MDNELENVNNTTEGPNLGRVSIQKTPSFISKTIFSNQKAKGAIPILKKQKIITSTEEKGEKNQENNKKREKSSWKRRYLKKQNRELWLKLIKEKGNKETDINTKQHQNLIREKSW